MAVTGAEVETTAPRVDIRLMLAADFTRLQATLDEIFKQPAFEHPALAAQAGGVLQHVRNHREVVNGSIGRVGKFPRQEFVEAGLTTQSAACGAGRHGLPRLPGRMPPCGSAA